MMDDTKIICPYCGGEQYEVDVDYSGYTFTVRCDNCDKDFNCEVFVTYTCYPEGIFIKSKDGELIDISDEIVKELEKGEHLYRHVKDANFVDSLYEVKEDTICQNDTAHKGDYIRAHYSYKGQREEISKFNLMVIRARYFFDSYIKVDGDNNEY